MVKTLNYDIGFSTLTKELWQGITKPFGIPVLLDLHLIITLCLYSRVSFYYRYSLSTIITGC